MITITSSSVIEWAKGFLTQADSELTPTEQREQKKFASLVQTPEYKTFLTTMLDESSQIRDNAKLNNRVRQIIRKYGIPDFFSRGDRLLIKLYMLGGYLFPSIAMPIFKYKLRRETDKIIISEERPKLTEHLAGRLDSNIGQNVNLLGEVVLGDGEAKHRYEHYLEALEMPDINYISIKLSGIYAQIKSLAYEQNKRELIAMVSSIYRKAMQNPYTDKAGKQIYKFVNLDMEEYKDMELTYDVFTETLSQPEFKNYTAGIVVQAYLPDAESNFHRLIEFAKKRVAEGGAPVKMRLVKGCNLQMESIVSSLKGWMCPVLHTKTEVDANYMHILDLALTPENTKVLNVGVASHNFFTIGYATLLCEQNEITDGVTFEMLEGMANHLPRVMRKLKKNIILYTPVVKSKYFLNAVSYLVRRLDENTGKENFLTHSFNLKLNSREWDFLRDQFIEAYKLKDTVNTEPYRTQDRRKTTPVAKTDVFVNEPDTDLDLPWNREWALQILKKWENDVNEQNFVVPVQIGDKEIITENKRLYKDRSRGDLVTVCEANLSSQAQVEEIIAIAEKDASGWKKKSVDERKAILFRVAENLSAKRGDLIGCMAAITGKTFTEGDVEVSEATDFCRFYPISMKEFDALETVEHSPKGVVLVIPPWNFPLAIPVGGCASALAAGNTVILKPATVALPVAWEFAKCFWDAGVPKDTLQVVCPAERSSLNYLSAHPAVKHIILTGGTDTAFRLLENSPRTPLSAETGGKNVIILTATGDQDHAILNVVSSAFGNAGQKCSACSLLLVERRTFEDETFKSKLKDAVESLRTGSVWDPLNYVGPMIDNRNDKLRHAIETFEEGESWLVKPEFVDELKYILKPCVKYGVKPGSYTFVNELFAPLLAVVCIDSFKQGIEFANSSEYGLTAGLQSLNEEEQKVWKDSIEAGNLYLNRGITGAIVRRQPFGGMKRSSFGGGIKAGGPNYVACFTHFTEKTLTDTPQTTPLSNLADNAEGANRINFAVTNYKKAWDEVFSVEEDVSHIYGEKNTFRYLPLKRMGLRVADGDSIADTVLVMLASHTAKTPLTVSISEANPNLAAIREAASHITGSAVIVEDEGAFVSSMGSYERIRTCTESLSDAIYEKAAQLGLYIADARPLVEGRLELLHYLKEQSFSFEYHRYGSVFGEEK
ncbi:MAG: bifunctional proline dehydrogenase/L-glutamate gamma-semialdehyde dehydrogenase [Dysgonamonadaceae bacterium]|jgi:RHH-type proline utilization regulon transcriptional repressor/proline dehydrogenase/delta 1-pyrroline-5-carboxylate dehydrogenase|nr:bifunctional proline dehydrogenase/L-glutamate gamma-semialdehyde dehydrogenase [Dysgonamonadaceae bacterium]